MCFFVSMLGVKVALSEAQKVKRFLVERNLMDKRFVCAKEEGYLVYPVIDKFECEYEFVQRDFLEKSVQRVTLKEALEDVLPAAVMERVKTAYDQVGDIAILEIDDELKEHEKVIGETLLKINSQVKTVLAKDDKHDGVFRTQKMRFLAGEDRRESVHKENGILLKVNVEEVYFSSRLSTERKRINDLIGKDEDVLVMFSGCGVYPVNIGKNTAAKSVLGVEINPVGNALAQENIRLNKLSNVSCVCGDVREVIPTLNRTFDRILMPLPKDAEHFLDVAKLVCKKGSIVHMYAFLHEDEFAKAHEWVRNVFGKCTILDTVKCGQQAPHVFRLCVDFRVD